MMPELKVHAVGKAGAPSATCDAFSTAESGCAQSSAAAAGALRSGVRKSGSTST